MVFAICGRSVEWYHPTATLLPRSSKNCVMSPSTKKLPLCKITRWQALLVTYWFPVLFKDFWFFFLQKDIETTVGRVTGCTYPPSSTCYLGYRHIQNKFTDDKPTIFCFWFFFCRSVCRAPVLLKLGFPVSKSVLISWDMGKIPAGAELLKSHRASCAMWEASGGISCAPHRLCGWKSSQL